MDTGTDAKAQTQYRNLGGILLAIVAAAGLCLVYHGYYLYREIRYISYAGTLSFTLSGFWFNIIPSVLRLAAMIFLGLFIVFLLLRKPSFLFWGQLSFTLFILNKVLILGQFFLLRTQQVVLPYAVALMHFGYLVLFVGVLFSSTTYFMLSVRVRTYMQNGDYLAKSLYTRRAVPPAPLTAGEE